MERLGRCGLCFETRWLAVSHFLPKSLYKQSRSKSAIQNLYPVVISADVTFSTSKQSSDLFLCVDCEKLFNHLGENYVLTQCVRHNGTFELRERIKKLKPVRSSEDCSIYEVTSLLGDKIKDYLYFAASVFWRAGARSWRLGTLNSTKIQLGKYQEELRQYLLGKSEFPTNGLLVVQIASDDDLNYVIPPSASGRINGVHRHKFYIPGILFALFLGGNLPKVLRKYALNSSQGSFMWVDPWKKDSLFDSFTRILETSKPDVKLATKIIAKYTKH